MIAPFLLFSTMATATTLVALVLLAVNALRRWVAEERPLTATALLFPTIRPVLTTAILIA